MKLVISSSELLKGIMTVAKAIPTKSALPILENFLFDLKGNTLEITASDSELTMKTSIEVENAEEEGQIAIPAKHLMDLLKELPEQPLSIKTISETSFELNMNHDAQYTNSIQKFELEFIFERSFPWVNQNISGSKEGSFSFFYNDFEESGKTFFGSCQS